MRPSTVFVVAFLALIAGCARTDAPVAPTANAPAAAPGAEAPHATAAPAWHLVGGSEGTALAVDDAAGGTALRLWCKPGDDRLQLNVPAFVPIASEERLSFGQGGEVVALVAGATGDATRGGVTAATVVPSNLRALLSGAVSASYGTQASGPHPVPPPALASQFVAACMRGAAGATRGGDAATTASAPVSACRVQQGEPVPANALRAVGTEPFWAAQVDGRCVTYSRPDHPSGTRVWTRFSGTAEAGTWTGALDGQPFVMRTRPQPGCSDGMSDARYPIGVSLTVGGEERRGCASPQ